MMNISSLFQFLIGFFLGIILFTAGIAGGAYFFLTQVSGNPPKPSFPEKTSPVEEKSPSNQTETTATKPEEKKETTETVAEETEDLPEGAYRARVTWSTGLSVRSQPSPDAERVGGVGYNWEIIILSSSSDGDWQKIRIPSSGEEGWVKAGNIEKINESQ